MYRETQYTASYHNLLCLHNFSVISWIWSVRVHASSYYMYVSEKKKMKALGWSLVNLGAFLGVKHLNVN